MLGLGDRLLLLLAETLRPEPLQRSDRGLGPRGLAGDGAVQALGLGGGQRPEDEPLQTAQLERDVVLARTRQDDELHSRPEALLIGVELPHQLVDLPDRSRALVRTIVALPAFAVQARDRDQ